MGALFTFEHEGRTARLRPRGELDLAARDLLAWWLADLTGRGLDQLDVDLSGVTFVDCACLGVLDQARRTLERRGATFTVVDPSPCVRAVSRLAGYEWPTPADDRARHVRPVDVDP